MPSGTLIGLAQCLITASALRGGVPPNQALDSFWAEEAHKLRLEINLVALGLWLLCLGAFVLPRKKDSEPEKASTAALRLSTRVAGGIFLGLFTFAYLFSYGPVRHAVLHNSYVKNVLRPKLHLRDDWVFRQIQDELPAQGRILNFGAGVNTFSDKLASEGYDVVPLDIVDESIAETPVVVYDGMKIPESLGQFDAAVISTVLHHIPDEYIDPLVASLAGQAKKIIIFEDVPQHNHESFVHTALFCVKTNVLLFNHPLNFRSTEAWQERFSKYNVVSSKLVGTENGSQYALIVLQP